MLSLTPQFRKTPVADRVLAGRVVADSVVADSVAADSVVADRVVTDRVVADRAIVDEKWECGKASSAASLLLKRCASIALMITI